MSCTIVDFRMCDLYYVHIVKKIVLEVHAKRLCISHCHMCGLVFLYIFPFDQICGDVFPSPKFCMVLLLPHILDTCFYVYFFRKNSLYMFVSWFVSVWRKKLLKFCDHVVGQMRFMILCIPNVLVKLVTNH